LGRLQVVARRMGEATGRPQDDAPRLEERRGTRDRRVPERRRGAHDDAARRGSPRRIIPAPLQRAPRRAHVPDADATVRRALGARALDVGARATRRRSVRSPRGDRGRVTLDRRLAPRVVSSARLPPGRAVSAPRASEPLRFAFYKKPRTSGRKSMSPLLLILIALLILFAIGGGVLVSNLLWLL